MRPEELRKYAAAVPRYTSYPTAPHFSPAIDAETCSRWLSEIPGGTVASLYVHIPFCNELCWYCGCSTKITRRHAPIARYLDVLAIEIDNVAGRLTQDCTIRHLHWGGGSPSILEPDDIRTLAARLKSRFHFADDAEFAVEIDPRGLDEARIAAFAEAGVNRVSIGIQDFEPDVQAAINRFQSFDMTKHVVEMFRAHGIDAINVDLVYGLPHQSEHTLRTTVDLVLSLEPQRIALFGYAHLPSRITHQRLINELALPGVDERFAQAKLAADRFADAGFVAIGLDHFARPDDPLAKGPVHRNFQGYTTDTADALIGLGASSIGQLPQGYVQNAPAIGDYERRITENGLATVRGHALSREDQARALVIERLMCDFRFPAQELRETFGGTAEPIIGEARALVANDADALVEPVDQDSFRVTDKGRIFVRTICSRFDSYLGRGAAQHSSGV